jgi:pyruvate, water dikinase
VDEGAVIRGIAASPGVAEGIARVLTRGDGRTLAPGEILVTVVTDPMSFVDIIDNAAALVTDLGGITSHPAILAREVGIPCVVGTQEATSRIADGSLVVVNGTDGTVRVG